MKLTKGFNPVIRATGVVSAVAIVAGGVTFAALNDSVVLANSSASTTNANLSIWNGSTFADTAPGFNVDNIVPGEDNFSDPFMVYLRNDSDADLKLTVKSNSPSGMVHTLTGGDDETPEGEHLNLEGVAPEDVMFKFTSYAEGCAENTVTASLTELAEGNVEMPCNDLSDGAQGNGSAGAENTEGNYSVQVGFKDADEEGASIDNLDLMFTGTVSSGDDEGEEGDV